MNQRHLMFGGGVLAALTLAAGYTGLAVGDTGWSALALVIGYCIVIPLAIARYRRAS